MAQQKCVSCNKFIKNGSKTCPHCGTVQPDSEVAEFSKVQDSKPDSEDKDTATRIDLFLAKLPLPVSFLLFLVVAYLFFSIIFVVISYISAPTLVAQDGLFSLYEDIYPMLLIFSFLLALAPLPTISQHKRALGLVTGESKVLDVISKLIVIAILFGVVFLFYSCSTSSSRFRGTEERWNELSPQEQRNAEQYNEYMNTLDSMRDN